MVKVTALDGADEDVHEVVDVEEELKKQVQQAVGGLVEGLVEEMLDADEYSDEEEDDERQFAKEGEAEEYSDEDEDEDEDNQLAKDEKPKAKQQLQSGASASGKKAGFFDAWKQQLFHPSLQTPNLKLLFNMCFFGASIYVSHHYGYLLAQ